MRVQYEFPGSEGWTRDTLSDVVPDVGESVVGPDDQMYVVELREWHLPGLQRDNSSPWVRVVLRSWERFREAELAFAGVASFWRGIVLNEGVR